MIFITVMKFYRKYLYLILIILIIGTTIVGLHIQTIIDYNTIIKGLSRLVNRLIIGSIFLFVGYSYAYIRSKVDFRKLELVLIMIVAVAINIYLYRFNHVDLRNSIIGNPVLYYVNAILGSLWILIFSELILKKNRILMFYGRNSLIIFATHLNLNILGYSESIIRSLSGMVSVNKILIFILTMCIETLLIVVINRYARWLLRLKIPYNN